MRILFMGTPEIASVALSALAKGGYTPVGAVCQPDKPAKRGMLLTPPPVKVTAESLGIPVYLYPIDFSSSIILFSFFR